MTKIVTGAICVLVLCFAGTAWAENIAGQSYGGTSLYSNNVSAFGPDGTLRVSQWALFDGDTANEAIRNGWSGDASVARNWYQDVSISSITLTKNVYGWDNPEQNIQIAYRSGGVWTTAFNGTQPGSTLTVNFGTPVTADAVNVYMKGNAGGYTRLYEMDIQGMLSGPAVTPTNIAPTSNGGWIDTSWTAGKSGVFDPARLVDGDMAVETYTDGASGSTAWRVWRSFGAANKVATIKEIATNMYSAWDGWGYMTKIEYSTNFGVTWIDVPNTSVSAVGMSSVGTKPAWLKGVNFDTPLTGVTDVRVWGYAPAGYLASTELYIYGEVVPEPNIAGQEYGGTSLYSNTVPAYGPDGTMRVSQWALFDGDTANEAIRTGFGVDASVSRNWYQDVTINSIIVTKNVYSWDKTEQNIQIAYRSGGAWTTVFNGTQPGTTIRVSFGTPVTADAINVYVNGDPTQTGYTRLYDLAVNGSLSGPPVTATNIHMVDVPPNNAGWIWTIWAGDQTGIFNPRNLVDEDMNTPCYVMGASSTHNSAVWRGFYMDYNLQNTVVNIQEIATNMYASWDGWGYMTQIAYSRDSGGSWTFIPNTASAAVGGSTDPTLPAWLKGVNFDTPLTEVTDVAVWGYAPASYLASCELYVYGQVVPAPHYIQGKLDLQDFAGDLRRVTVWVQLRQGATVLNLPGRVANPDTGIFSAVVPAGTYDVWIKPDHWLAVLVSDVVVNGPTDLGTISFVNGDSDEDNEVTTSDLANVLYAMDAMPGDPNWLSAADLDEDGEVTTSDLATVLLNMDLMGDW